MSPRHDHPAISVRVPERKAADLGKLIWRAVATPPELKELPLDGPVRRFDSADNLTIRGKATIELPCEASEATVLVRGTLGLWIPLPSEAITSDDGRSARRVVIDSEPTPWLFALTTDPEAARPPNDALMAEIVRFEQRHWTSKTLADDELAPTRPKTASAERRASGPAFVGVANAQETWRADEVKGTVALAWHTLRRISSTFHDEATLQRMRMDGNDPMAWAWQEYRTGIGLLSELRNVLRGTLESVRFTDARPIFGGPVSADPWSAETADSARPPTSSQADEFREASSRRTALFLIEALAADYAPWGIQTVKAMIDSSPSGGPLFDLRVLTPVGNLNFVDMERPEKTELPGAVETDLRNLPRSPLTGVERKLALRLYSSRRRHLHAGRVRRDADARRRRNRRAHARHARAGKHAAHGQAAPEIDAGRTAIESGDADGLAVGRQSASGRRHGIAEGGRRDSHRPRRIRRKHTGRQDHITTTRA